MGVRIEVISVYIEDGVKQVTFVVVVVQRSLDQEEPCKWDGKILEHHLEILSLKLRVATGRDFGGGGK